MSLARKRPLTPRTPEQERSAERALKRQANLFAHVREFKYAAARRDCVMLLSDIELAVIFVADCFYCGKSWDGTRWQSPDREDNNLRVYSVANTAAACWPCNHNRGDRTRTEYIQHIVKIYKHMKRKESHKAAFTSGFNPGPASVAVKNI